ncbi:MAG: Ig-like domain-containing protein, partial [Betaproteobacteria bacterium]
MKLKLTPIAFAVCSTLPFAAHAAPKVSFVAPTSGQTISGSISQSSACEVKGTSDIRRVIFYLDGAQLNTEGRSPWNCNIDTRQFSDGAHRLRAVAYDSRGASAATEISVTIANGTSAASGPTVQFTAPAEGGALSGNVQGPPNCVVTGSN